MRLALVVQSIVFLVRHTEFQIGQHQNATEAPCFLRRLESTNNDNNLMVSTTAYTQIGTVVDTTNVNFVDSVLPRR